MREIYKYLTEILDNYINSHKENYPTKDEYNEFVETASYAFYFTSNEYGILDELYKYKNGPDTVMLDFLKNLPEEIKHFFWLMVVSFIGGIVGFVTKNSKTLEGKSWKQKLWVLFVSMISSMFIAYITFEIVRFGIDKQGVAVAISGFAAYMGTDILIIVQERLVEKIKSKIDSI